MHDVKHIIIMNAGQIQVQGSYEFIKESENDFSSFLRNIKSTEKDDDDDVDVILEVKTFYSL